MNYRKFVETLHTEVQSNPRLGIMQLFGSDSGFVVSHAVLASSAGHATLALIPEIEFSAVGVAHYLKKRLWEAAASRPDRTQTPKSDRIPPHGLVIFAETAVPLDALACLGMMNLPDEMDEGLRKTYETIAVAVQATEEEKKLFASLRIEEEKRSEWRGKPAMLYASSGCA